MTSSLPLQRARLFRVRLPLARRMETAHGAIDEREALVLELEDAEGRRGYGEATPLPDFGTEDLAASRAALEEWTRAAPSAGRSNEPALAQQVTNTPCAAFAWSTAWMDLTARREDVSLVSRLGALAGLEGASPSRVASQALVGGAAPDAVADRARAAREQGFGAFKLKLAVSPETRDPALDVERVAALREAVGSSARVRLDANEAWGEVEAQRALAAFARFDVDYVEQPVARSDVTALARLAADPSVTVAADEALQGDGWRACLEAGLTVFVVKPAALGSLDVSIDLARRVREAGGRLVWSTLIDGAIGRGVACALAAATGDPNEVHGLGTGPLLTRDLVPQADAFVDGTLPVPSGPGLGVVPSDFVLDAAELLFEVRG